MSGQALANYYRILEEETRANYLKTKATAIDVDLSADDATLWEEHDSALRSSKKGSSSGTEVSLLDLKIELAQRILKQCRFCERRCGSNRLAGEKGHCGVLRSRINSDFLHMGEEPDLVPSYTIFFSGCTFNCVFCQNWDISTRPESGLYVSSQDMARKIEQRAGTDLRRVFSARARNVNWVGGDPTSNLPYILAVLKDCAANTPQVWNSNMYLTEEAMRLLDGIVDVYLTDFKYGNDRCALRLSNAPNYLKVIQRNHVLGRAQAEMIIRHLVLPGHVECCTRPVLIWIAENLTDVKVNVMGQYRPEFKARDFPEIAHPLRMAEYSEAIEIAEELGLDLCD